MVAKTAMCCWRLRSLQQLQDLHLVLDVQVGRGLVQKQELGLLGQRHGDDGALPLASG